MASKFTNADELVLEGYRAQADLMSTAIDAVIQRAERERILLWAGGLLGTVQRASVPKVTIVFRLQDLLPRQASALELGALLLSNYLDGAFGTDVRARFQHYGGLSMFRLDVTLPHEKPMVSARNEAVALLRYLTHVPVPEDLHTLSLLVVVAKGEVKESQ